MFHELLRDDVLRIETQRLWLRWPETGDARALQEIASHRAVAEMTASWPHPLPNGEAARRICRIRQSNAEGRSVVMAIERKRRPAWFMGLVSLHDLGTGRAGVGYLAGAHFSGQGLMTEALGALLTFVLPLSSSDIIEASVRTDNPASRRVLEKCGFTWTASGPIDAPARAGKRLAVDHFRLKAGRVAWSRRIAA
ncbi:MAG: hypothetical protein RLZ98_3262 [Pseudomonadota bacterium]|jgi:RimJ/RimL family protein N-acetyltransferase